MNITKRAKIAAGALALAGAVTLTGGAFTAGGLYGANSTDANFVGGATSVETDGAVISSISYNYSDDASAIDSVRVETDSPNRQMILSFVGGATTGSFECTEEVVESVATGDYECVEDFTGSVQATNGVTDLKISVFN